MSDLAMASVDVLSDAVIQGLLWVYNTSFQKV